MCRTSAGYVPDIGRRRALLVVVVAVDVAAACGTWVGCQILEDDGGGLLRTGVCSMHATTIGQRN